MEQSGGTSRTRTNGAGDTRARTRSPLGRGRPPKFGRPSQVVALTLPQDVLELLRTLHQDPGWAIVRLVESVLGKGGQQRAKAPTAAIAELVHLPGGRALIVVQPKAFMRLRGVSTIPLADGRAFLALDQGGGLADLEVALLDRVETASRAERPQLTKARDIVRAWRRTDELVFRTKSIIVVESASSVERRPLAALHEVGGPANRKHGRRRRR